MVLKAIIEQGENGWLVGQLEEITSVMTQGKTIPELKANLLDALGLYMEVDSTFPTSTHYEVIFEKPLGLHQILLYHSTFGH